MVCTALLHLEIPPPYVHAAVPVSWRATVGIIVGLNCLPHKFTSSSICTPASSLLVSHLVLLCTQLSTGGRFILCYKGPSRPSPGHLSQCLHMALSTKVWALSNSSCTFLACSKAVPSSLCILSCPTFLVCTLSGTVTVSCYKGRKRSPFLPADSAYGITLARFILPIARIKFYHLW